MRLVADRTENVLVIMVVSISISCVQSVFWLLWMVGTCYHDGRI